MQHRQISGHVLRSGTFGCVPVTDDERTRAALNDLCQALSEGFDLDIRPHRAPSAQALSNAYQAGRVHLAWTSAAAVAIDPALAGATPLVRSVREGASQYHGVIFVRRDSPIRSAAQLGGARMGWVSATSAGGYLFARTAMRDEGADPDSTLGAQAFLGSHGAVAEAVERGDVEAGATFAVFEGGDASRGLLRTGYGEAPERLAAFRVLLTTPAIPSDVVVASGSLLATLRVDPVEVLTALHERDKAAEAMRHVLGADRFEPADPAAIDALRSQLPTPGTSFAAG